MAAAAPPLWIFLLVLSCLQSAFFFVRVINMGLLMPEETTTY
jgi:hypothetical protein